MNLTAYKLSSDVSITNVVVNGRYLVEVTLGKYDKDGDSIDGEDAEGAGNSQYYVCVTGSDDHILSKAYVEEPQALAAFLALLWVDDLTLDVIKSVGLVPNPKEYRC